MAKKVSKPQAQDVAAPASVGADDLQVLHPEQSLQVGGRDITVREYGFVEGLQLRPKVQPLLDDLYALLLKGGIELEDVIVALGNHSALTTELVAIAADVDQGFLAGLNQRDGYRLLMAWWTVNGPFYLSALVERRRAEVAAALARQRVGATSMPSSSPESTEPPPTSVE